MPTLKEEIVEIIKNVCSDWASNNGATSGTCASSVDYKAVERFADQILLAIQARLLKDAFIDYPDTEDGRKARYENSLYNSAIQKMRDSLK